ncbi:MAG: hypothetical protein JSS14_14715 [Proteobacteria bacterium]|nr:hypothetical protein [Pseudomonadota bacterium]
MSQDILKRIVSGCLPMRFARRADIGHLHSLCDAGYLNVTFSPPNPGHERSATVTDITPLGRAVIRYFGFWHRDAHI